MTVVLGLNTFHADASCALVHDGLLLGAIAEERINRIKHFAGLPVLATRRCLEMANLMPSALTHIAIARDSHANISRKLTYALKHLGVITTLAKQRIENRAKVGSSPKVLAAQLGLATGVDNLKICNVEHHLAHVASSFLVSPFEKAALQSIDGFGDFASSMSGLGEGNRIKVYDRVYFPHSLGILYTAVCQFIGFSSYGDEGKVMGLAPYGKDTYRDSFENILRLLPSGQFALDLDYFSHHTEGVDYTFGTNGSPSVAPLYSRKMEQVFGPPRTPRTELTQRDMDLAHSLQSALERGYFHLLNALYEKTHLETLCLAGGVALNSVANGKIFSQTPFKRVYIQAAASDDGTALGAAFFVWNCLLKQPRTFVMNHAYTGPEFDDNAHKTALLAAGLNYETLDDPTLCKRVAMDIANGLVVGWFQGRMEWGPRALGNRSILAHPGYNGMKDILNSRVKHREWFRPFAPAVLEEKIGVVFENDHPDPFMLMVYKIRPEWREKLSAVNHVDNTGRLQSVSTLTNPKYHRLIQEFDALTGIPVLLNTSFNENEPIVLSPTEAIDCFKRTRMDTLALGNYYVTRK